MPSISSISPLVVDANNIIAGISKLSVSPVISNELLKSTVLPSSKSSNKSPILRDSLSPGIVTKVTKELFPSSITLPEVTFKLLNLVFDNVISAAVKIGKYNVLFSPFIKVVLLSLLVILTEILKFPYCPNTSFGLTFFPLNS